MTSDAPQNAPKPTLWGRLKAHILHPELTESQVAWSFAIGLAMAWNPLLGTHTWLVLLLCFFSRHLHRPLMLLACFINNPWTLVPMATASALLGNVLMGRGFAIDLSGVHWNQIGWASFTTREGFSAMGTMLRPILAPYLLGGFALSLISLPLGHWLMIRLTRRLRAHPLHLPFHHGGPHGHAIPDASGPADAGEAAGGPAEPPR
jgi:uncharacterized protein (DUF2062 family)